MIRFRWVAASASLLLSGFIFSDNQKVGLQKSLTGSKSFSTGLAQVALDTSDLGKLVEHSLKGAAFPNGLYQTFFGLTYESMGPDSLLHSGVARTHGQGFPGDKTDWISETFSQKFRSSAEGDTYAVKYSNLRVIDFLSVEEILRIPSDSGRAIGLEFVFHVTLDSGDTIRNAAMIFGYDADLGSQTGGYGDDESGSVIEDSLQLLYACDATGDLVTGLSYQSGGSSHAGGNILGFHQTVNRLGAPSSIVDSVLLNLIQAPSFSLSAPPGDVSLYWVVNLGTYADTLSDTVRFLLVNGHTRSEVENAALGRNAPAVLPSRSLSFALLPNYPNPFNPATLITYELFEATEIELSVYNVLGQKIRKLERGHRESGSHTVTWDGRNDRGHEVGSGVYFYRLSSPDQHVTRKMTLLK